MQRQDFIPGPSKMNEFGVLQSVWGIIKLTIVAKFGINTLSNCQVERGEVRVEISMRSGMLDPRCARYFRGRSERTLADEEFFICSAVRVITYSYLAVS